MNPDSYQNAFTKPPRTRRQNIILGIIVAVLVLGAISIVYNYEKSKHPAVSPTSKQLKPQLVVDNLDLLSKALLSKQYTLVHQTLVDYIHERSGADVTHATVLPPLQTAKNGNISFVVKVDKPASQFTVTIDKATAFDKIIFKVPETGYEKPLQIYGSPTKSDTEKAF